MARFAIGIEAALVSFMGPLVQRVNDAATGGTGGKVGGDWKAAKELLAMRFPNQWSERVHVAKSQKVEIGGTIEHDFFVMRLRSMSDAELRAELESIHWSMRSSMMFGDDLGEVISCMEEKLSLMKHHYAAKTAFFPDRETSWRPGSKAPREIEPKLIEHEDAEICAAVLQAPDTAEGPVVVAEPSATPHVYEDPRPTGIGYDQHGLAFRYDDEDIKL